MQPLTAFHSVALESLPVEDAIAFVARHGYDAIELNAETLPWARPHVTDATPPQEREKIRRAVAEAGLAISSISAHIPLAPPDEEERQRAVAFTKGCIDLAVDLGTDIVHGLAGEPAPGQDLDQAWPALVDSVRACTAYAAQRNVRFAFEAVTGMIVHNVASLQRLLDEVPGLYVNFDPSHLAVEGDDIPAAVAALADKIVHCHFKDALGKPGDYKFPPLGEGKVDLQAFLQALRRNGYRGYISVEYEGHVFGYEEEIEKTAEKSLRFIKANW